MRAPALLMAAMGACLAGCAVAPAPDFSVHRSRDGVVLWRGDHSSGRARLTCEWGDEGDFRARVYDARPRLTVLRFQGRWAISGPEARGGWSGVDAAVPPALEGWLGLGEACEGARRAASGESDVRTGRFSVRYVKSGERIESLELVTLATGERFRVKFD